MIRQKLRNSCRSNKVRKPIKEEHFYHSAGIVGHDEIGLDVVVFEVGVALSTVTRLHLVVFTEALKCLLRDVHPSKNLQLCLMDSLSVQTLVFTKVHSYFVVDIQFSITHPATPPLSI